MAGASSPAAGPPSLAKAAPRCLSALPLATPGGTTGAASDHSWRSPAGPGQYTTRVWDFWAQCKQNDGIIAIKLFGNIKSKRIKLFAIYLMHTLHRRYIGIYIDPVLGCNYRCKMCYFSDENARKELHGKISEEDLELIAKALFNRALKLQIGCGAEPTIANNIEQTIKLGKKYNIPYISLTTNGKLVTKEKLISFIESGLNEITISTHGLKKDTYEKLMGNGDYDHFISLARDFAEFKEKYPSFKIRIKIIKKN